MTVLWIAFLLFLLYFLFQTLWSLKRFPRIIEGIRTGRITRASLYVSQMAGLWVPAAAVLLLAATGQFAWADVGLSWFRLSGSVWIVVPAAVLAALYLAYLLYTLVTMWRSTRQGKPVPQRVPERIRAMFPVTRGEKRLWACTAVSAGIAEELLFRGFLFYALGALFPWMPVWAVLLVATALFGLGHLYQGAGEAVQPSLIGLLYGIFYIASGTILPCVLLHAAQDLCAVFAVNEAQPDQAAPDGP
jgi:membrane protease YdiL (CAAX protease family)